MEVFGFLKAVCARCGIGPGTEKGQLYKIGDGNWVCHECLKEGEYKDSWDAIRNKVSRRHDPDKEDPDEVYKALMLHANEILKYKIAYDHGAITKEEYDEKAQIFFAK